MTTRGLFDVITPLNDERDLPMIDFYNLVAKAYLNDEGHITFYRSDSSLDEFLAFETKDEYLAWRTEWKQAYAALSADIRRIRTEWRAEGQVHADELTHGLFRSRKLARLMLALRHESKRKAERLYQASREDIPQEAPIS